MWYLHPFVCSWHVWLKIELKPKQNIQRVNFRLHSPLHLCMLVNEFCFDIIIYDFMKRCFIGIIRWYKPQDINIVISSLVTLLCQNSNMVNILFAKYLLGKNEIRYLLWKICSCSYCSLICFLSFFYLATFM